MVAPGSANWGCPHGLEGFARQEPGRQVAGPALGQRFSCVGSVGDRPAGLRRAAGIRCRAFLQRAAPEHDPHEPREVQDCRVHAAGRRHAEFEAGRVEIRPVETPHVRVREVVDDRGIRRKRAAGHPHGLDDGALDVVREGLTLCHLQRVPHDRDPRIRVLGVRLRLVYQRSPVQAGDRGREIGAGVIEIVSRGRFPDEPGAVRHELAQGEGPSRSGCRERSRGGRSAPVHQYRFRPARRAA